MMSLKRVAPLLETASTAKVIMVLFSQATRRPTYSLSPIVRSSVWPTESDRSAAVFGLATVFSEAWRLRCLAASLSNL